MADGSNNRVLMFEAAIYRSTQPYPDRVLGQPDFTTVSSLTCATKMSSPQAVWVDSNDRLWVAEYNNNRVLRFDAVSTKANGAAADGVLGQVNFTNNGSSGGSSGFQQPTGVAVSANGTIFVSCNSGHRILRFNNAASLGNGAGATAVLGQEGFTSATAGWTATQLSGPWGVWLTPDDSLWVCDNNNTRFLRYDKSSTLSNGAAATGVVGQPNFTTGLPGLTNRSISNPYLLPYLDATGSLWVPDRGNQRVLRFAPDETRPLLALTGNVPQSTSAAKLTIKGTASDANGISKVTYKVNSGSTKTATGTTSWQFKANLKPGKNKITINAVDSVGNKSANKVLNVERN